MPKEESTAKPGELGIFKTSKPILPEPEEGEGRRTESTLTQSTLERRKREVVIPIKPTGETYRRGTSFKDNSHKKDPFSSMSSSMIVLPSTRTEKKPFVVPKLDLLSESLPPEPRSQTIVMRKKKGEVDCTADTTITAAPRARQTATKTLKATESAKEAVSLSVSLSKEDEGAPSGKRERNETILNEVDKLEKEMRKLQEMTRKAEERDKSRTPPVKTSSPPKEVVVVSSTLPRVTRQPVDLLPSSLPPKSRPDKMVEADNRGKNLASRVKEGFADFTHGSSDRLMRWKSKLQSTGRRQREKDGSAPPPLSRSMQASSPDVLVDWSVNPRPLHVTRSASNAITLSPMEHRTLKFDVGSQQIYPSPRSHYEALPPPARLVPFSGSRPTDNSGIIRPIAFRPLIQEDMQRRPQHKIEHTKSALNLSSTSVSRPRAVYPSTSNSFSAVRHENEYDTVSDILTEKEKSNDDLCKLSASSGSSGGGSIGHRKTTSRQSTGAHITPSPSDSGIVDYETIIRDKENELQGVRKTMEQNEEIIVKVYLEKEKTWKEQLDQMRHRLAASEKGEAALRMQMSSLSRQAEAMNDRVARLEEEKSQLTLRLREAESSRECESCRRSNSASRPIPAPRTVKANEMTDSNLRDEVSELRREVATLKDALHFLPENKRNAVYANANPMVSPRDRLI